MKMSEALKVVKRKNSKAVMLSEMSRTRTSPEIKISLLVFLLTVKVGDEDMEEGYDCSPQGTILRC